MKLVDQYIDPNMATAARVRLRIAGIAAFVDSMDPHAIQPSHRQEVFSACAAAVVVSQRKSILSSMPVSPS